MDRPFKVKKIVYFSLTRMLIGISVVVGAVALGLWLTSLLPANFYGFKRVIESVVSITMAMTSYILLFRFYENRSITELSLAAFGKEALTGFSTGIILQSMIVVVLYLAAGYMVLNVNHVSVFLPAFFAALTAGFVAEILIRGIFFRLSEEKLGTTVTLIVSGLCFAIMHAGSSGASIYSMVATAIQAGVLPAAAFVYSRRLWIPIFFHFAWDFAEPGIYGGINPGISEEGSLLTSRISGPEIWTGGQTGPGSSIQSIVFCACVSTVFISLAIRDKKWIGPSWKK
jgi:membrane protease YdiL (CAAX protease family)